MSQIHHSPFTIHRSPLAGRTVLITRSAGQAEGMAERLRALGAEPIICPTIAYAPPEDRAALDAALARLAAGAYDWLVLTSAEAVRAVAERPVFTIQPATFNIAAVGPATAAAAAELLGRAPSLVPERFVADDLAAALGDLAGARVLLPNADLAKPGLEERLRAAGAAVDRVLAYRTVAAPDTGLDLAALLAAGQIDAITFTSGSTVRFFLQRLGPEGVELARSALIACIGPSTAAACRAVGLAPTLVAAVSTEEGLVAALADHFARPMEAQR
jgi:uroporphyrinogen-III synthase